MNDLSPTRLFLMRCAFLLLALAILVFQLLPLETTPRSWAGPDVLLAFAFAWCLRRPEYVPALTLAVAFLLADLLLQRPPGLWSLLALISCENVKSRGRSLRDAGFGAEWMTVAVSMIAIAVLHRLVLALVLVDVPSLTLSLSALGTTILIYPLVVGITHFLMGVRKTAHGDLDALGQRV